MLWILFIAAAAAALLFVYFFFGLSDLHFHKKPRAGMTRIACMGDSITNGALIPFCFFRSYPAVLEKILEKGFHAENFGLNGRTLQLSADRPFEREKEYRLAVSFAPDIAVIMLGTNDTKPQNWKGAEAFLAEYRRYLSDFRESSGCKDIILCTPVWGVNAKNRFQYFTNDTDAAHLPEIAECVRQIARENGLRTVDLYALTEGRRDLISYDGCHPNARGAGLIAAELARLISRKCVIWSQN